MKRSLLIGAGTAVGVTAVVSYHAAGGTSGSHLPSVGTVHSVASAPTKRTRTSTGSAPGSDSATATRPATTSSASPTAPRVARSAVGAAIAFQYGRVQVKVSERAGKITGVSIVSFQIAGPHSESIDEVAVPQLDRQVIAAQSAHIDGVSGASYTSEAYEQSVQSALDRL